MVSDSRPIEGLDYSDLVIALAAATAAPLLVDLLPIPSVPPLVTEILAGILIGPELLDLVQVSAPLEVFSQVGLVFLFFLAGLEIAFDAEGDRHLGTVGAAFAVSLALAFLVAFGFDAAGLAGAPVLVAIILAATSFGIVVAVLRDAGQTKTTFGQLVIAGASLADVATVILRVAVLLRLRRELRDHAGPAAAVPRPGGRRSAWPWPAPACRPGCARRSPACIARAPRSACGSRSCCSAGWSTCPRSSASRWCSARSWRGRW